MWLMDPEESIEPGQCWTRDPDKAWQFDQEYTHGDEDRPFNTLTKKHVATMCITATKIILSMRDEEVAPADLKITEHEFVNMSIIPDSKSDLLLDHVSKDIYDRNFGRVYSTYSEGGIRKI